MGTLNEALSADWKQLLHAETAAALLSMSADPVRGVRSKSDLTFQPLHSVSHVRAKHFSVRVIRPRQPHRLARDQQQHHLTGPGADFEHRVARHTGGTAEAHHQQRPRRGTNGLGRVERKVAAADRKTVIEAEVPSTPRCTWRKSRAVSTIPLP